MVSAIFKVKPVVPAAAEETELTEANARLLLRRGCLDELAPRHFALAAVAVRPPEIFMSPPAPSA